MSYRYLCQLLAGDAPTVIIIDLTNNDILIPSYVYNRNTYSTQLSVGNVTEGRKSRANIYKETFVPEYLLGKAIKTIDNPLVRVIIILLQRQ